MRVPIVLLTVLLVSCGSDVTCPPDARPAPRLDAGPTAKQACLDLCNGYASMSDRCTPGSYSTAYSWCLQQVRGSCDNVVRIRDEHELYTECLPWFTTVACAYVTSSSFAFDTSCQTQLLLP